MLRDVTVGSAFAERLALKVSPKPRGAVSVTKRANNMEQLQIEFDGVLCDKQIRSLYDAGVIMSGIRENLDAEHKRTEISPEQFQPASLDLRLGAMAYAVRASFLPQAGTEFSKEVKSRSSYNFPLKT